MRKGTMELSDEWRQQIKESLAPLHPEKVIVFGSYAHGTSNSGDTSPISVLD